MRKVTRKQALELLQWMRARLERMVHDVDAKCGRQAATFVRDEILFEFDQQTDELRQELLDGEFDG